MAEYALTKDGSTVDQTRQFKDGETPASFSQHPTKSAWKWLAVTRLQPEDGQSEGWTLNVGAGSASYRPEYVAPTPRKVGTFSEFMGLFTDAQQMAIDVAATPGTALSLMLKRATASNEIDLTAQIVVDAMTLLVAGGLITEQQKTAILGVDFDA